MDENTERRYITRIEARIDQPPDDAGWRWRLLAFASHRGEAYLVSSGGYSVTGPVPPEWVDDGPERCFDAMREAFPQLIQATLAAPPVDDA